MMMMQVLRPVRASASRLLATPTTNSTADYQQPHAFVPIDAGGGFVAVQPPTTAGTPVSPGYVGDNNVANLPVIWPMHNVFNTPSCSQNEDPAICGEAIRGNEQISAALQCPAVESSQVSNYSHAGNTVWHFQPVVQATQYVFWPVVRNAYEGMSGSGPGMQACINDVSVGDACTMSSEALVCNSHPQPSAAPAPTSHGGYGSAAVERSQGLPQHASAQSEKTSRASGARRQRRSKRSSAAAETKRVENAAVCPEEMQELRLAVKNTEEACVRRRSENDPELLKGVPQLTVRWADALDDEEAESQYLQQSSVSPVPINKREADCQMTVGDFRQAKPVLDFAVTSVPESDFLGISCTADADFDPILLELDNVDGHNFRSTMDGVLSSVWSLASTKRGCRIVQKALEVASSADKQEIAEKLHGHVNEAVRSPHANHVLQKCIEILPPGSAQFVLSELHGEGAFTARHRFGCRILQRLIEHCPYWQTEELISEVLADTARLCRHQYGNFVIQHVLQHGSPTHRHAIADALCEDTIRLAKHRVASHVLSCAIVHCSAEDVERLTKVVLEDAGQLADLSRRQYGSFVVREVNRAARLMQA